ncbi:MAG: ATPase [Candidatus Staskawiczbacteria bacterium RIFCSPHIGHO2_02_FULL_43_16]|nr:MAG: ATPase [Candidatus Staskawiczbacteria bacterium RIFCSPHIGHO2_02_FULL_43_16]OGZ74456.1 MAG: ATPase [Candidatus Staskawiczbacteria bacterium RIFCSPLOWO2_01_FULL_43_17b]
MYTQTYRIKGMHCASCSSVIEKTLKKVAGVQDVQANFGTETAKVSFDATKTNPQELSKKIEPLGYSFIMPMHAGHGGQTAEQMGMSAEEHAAHTGLGQSKQEKLAEVADMKMKIMMVMPLATFSILLMAWETLTAVGVAPKMPETLFEFFHHLLPIFATATFFIAGKPYLMGFYRFLRYGKANMDSLIGIGTSAAFLYSFIVTAFEGPLSPFLNVENVYYDVTIVVIAFITLGKYLEAKAKIKTGDAIEKLLNLQAKTALVIRGGKETEISVDQVLRGDRIVVKPGARIPVDGTVLEGSSFIDESMVTGESMPVEKKAGDAVVAGTINTTGAFIFEAKKIGSETLLAHIVKMVQEAQGSRAPIQKLADQISAVFVPIVIVLAFLSLGAWLVIGTAYFGFAQALSYALVSFVGILVIACPCALGLATPTAIIVGVGKGAKEGILIKDAATLEKLHKVDMVVVDKTGTITKGKPEVTSVSDESIMQVFASLESKSEHPVAHAIVEYVKKKNVALLPVSHFEIIQGKGLKGTIEGVEYFAGSFKLMADIGLSFEGGPQLVLATKEKVLGTVMVADAIKPEAIEAVKNLHKLGIKVIMLTGDHKNTALAIAKEVGIDDVLAEVLPDEKLNKIKELQKQGRIVAMAGDGINDAPALAQADVGIAMATGTDVAIETAGITLLGGDISKLVKAIRLSKLTMRGIKQNLFWAFIYNIVGIPLAGGAFFPFFGWLLNPIFAGMAMALSSVSVVANSLRIKAKRI